LRLKTTNIFVFGTKGEAGRMETIGMKKKVVSGLFWRYVERCVGQGVSLIVGIILARILMPEDYGLVSLSVVFINILTVVGDLGLNQAIIQKKEVDETECNSVYYTNLLFNIGLYLLIFFTAPLGAEFYKEPELTEIIRFSALSLVISGTFSMQFAQATKEMKFKKYFYATILGNIVSALIGVYMALTGYGVWALLWQAISNQLVSNIALTFMIRWKPKLLFSFKKLKPLFKFGWKYMVSWGIDHIYNNLYSLIIGKVYSKESLAYYNRGNQYPTYIIYNINQAIMSVIFPALSKEQDNIDDFRRMVRRAIKTSTFIVFPCMAGFAAMGKGIIVALITEKWLPAVPFLCFSCFTYALWPLQTTNLQAISAKGRSDIFLKLEIVKKVFGVTVLIVTIPFGLMPMMWGSAVTAVIVTIVNIIPNKKLIGYGVFEQIKDVLPAFLLSIVMLVCVKSIELLGLNVWITILIQLITGIALYIGGAILFKLESFEYLLDTVKEYLPKGKKHKR